MMNAGGFAGTVSTTLHQGVVKFILQAVSFSGFIGKSSTNPLSLHQVRERRCGQPDCKLKQRSLAFASDPATIQGDKPFPLQLDFD